MSANHADIAKLLRLLAEARGPSDVEGDDAVGKRARKEARMLADAARLVTQHVCLRKLVVRALPWVEAQHTHVSDHDSDDRGKWLADARKEIGGTP